MKTFKQYLKESKQINESLKLADYQGLTYDILSSADYREKAFKVLNVESSDELFDEVYFRVKKPADCYKIIKDVTKIDLKHMNDKQANEILYILCFGEDWLERIANIMIKHNIADIPNNWTESYIMIPFESKELSSKELKLIVKELGI